MSLPPLADFAGLSASVARRTPLRGFADVILPYFSVEVEEGRGEERERDPRTRVE